MLFSKILFWKNIWLCSSNSDRNFDGTQHHSKSHVLNKLKNLWIKNVFTFGIYHTLQSFHSCAETWQCITSNWQPDKLQFGSSGDSQGLAVIDVKFAKRLIMISFSQNKGKTQTYRRDLKCKYNLVFKF